MNSSAKRTACSSKSMLRAAPGVFRWTVNCTSPARGRKMLRCSLPGPTVGLGAGVGVGGGVGVDVGRGVCVGRRVRVGKTVVGVGVIVGVTRVGSAVGVGEGVGGAVAGTSGSTSVGVEVGGSVVGVAVLSTTAGEPVATAAGASVGTFGSSTVQARIARASATAAAVAILRSRFTIRSWRNLELHLGYFPITLIDVHPMSARSPTGWR